MKIKKILQEPLLYLLPLLAIACIIIFSGSPKISNIKLIRNNKIENITLPYSISMPKDEVFFISFDVSVKKDFAKFNIIPDDCIQEVLINEKNFPLDGINGLCDYSNGAHFDFSEYVQAGLNHFLFRIDNRGGGNAGLALKSPKFSLMHYIFALLFIASLVLIIIKLIPIVSHLENKYDILNKLSKIQYKIIFISILCFAVAIRLWNISEVPNGLNQDEASLAYDAYADVFYGMDRNGDHNPIYAVSWGSGQNMLYNYVLRPFIMIFGLNDMIVRIPMCIFSIFSLIIFYLLLRLYFDKNVALLGFFLLSFNPWHIILSRWAVENNFVLPVFLTGVYLVALSYKKPPFFIPGMLFLALSLYAYAASSIVLAVFIPLLIFYILWRKAIPVKYTALGILTFCLVAAPFATWFIINKFNLPAIKLLGFSIPRMTVMRSDGIVSFKTENITHFAEVMFTGLDGWIFDGIAPFGAFYPFMLPFVLFGIYVLFSKCRGYAAEMKFWFVSAVFLALIIEMNIGRVNLLLFPLIFLATLGIAEINRHSKFVVPILAVFIMVVSIAFVKDYFKIFRENDVYSGKFTKAIEYAVENSQQNFTIYYGHVPYTLVLYAVKMPPQRFLNTVVWENPNVEFRETLRFDRFVLGIPEFLREGEVGVFRRNEINDNIKSTAKKITEFGNFTVVEN